MDQVTEIMAELEAMEALRAARAMESFCFWTLVSVLVCFTALIWSFLVKPRLRKSPQTMSALNHFTIGVFLAGVFLFIPGNAMDVAWEGVDFQILCGSIFHTFFWSLVNSLRLFVLGIDPDAIRSVLPAEPAQTSTLISIYAAIIYFLTPALTFTTVLSFFSNFVSTLRLRLCRFRKIYIMSELNAQALAMAGEIAEENRRKLVPPLLVFANTPAETDYDARQQARRLNGLCLKADASHLRIARHGRPVEIFLLGNNETENVAQAISLTEHLQNYPREISVYVYAPMDYADNVLDSLYADDRFQQTKEKTAPQKSAATSVSESATDPVAESATDPAANPTAEPIAEPTAVSSSGVTVTTETDPGTENEGASPAASEPTADGKSAKADEDEPTPLLSEYFKEWIETHSESLLTGSEWTELCVPLRGKFSIRRIDPVNMLVRSVLTNNNYKDYEKLFTDAQEDKVISITILGMGRYGSHYLKTAVWFYQKYGYRVEINVIDVGAENGDIEKRFAMECPELISKGNAAEDDDAQYDIRFFLGVDCLSSDLGDLIEKSGRFEATKLVFIALGEDELNIQVAMNLRTLFDRLQARQQMKYAPFIYALIYDDQKVSNLSANSFGNNFHDSKGNAFDICFVSALTSQYSYRVINIVKELEETAFKHHLDWSRKQSQLRIYYEIAQLNESPFPTVDLNMCKAFRDALNESLNNKAPKWDDNNFITYDKNSKERPFGLNLKELNFQAEKYIRYAYNRNSSIAKAEHKKALTHFPAPKKPADKDAKQADQKDQHHPNFPELCACKACTQRRITEHMRWNAYMRGLGYVYGKRSDRAKQHNDLLPWRDLALVEQLKD